MHEDRNQNDQARTTGINPDSSLFEELEPGILRTISATGRVEGGRLRKAFAVFNRAVLGQPLATKEEPHQRLSKVKALPILASDNISSSAYATEEIIRVLAIAGLGALSLTLPISLSLVAVLAVVVLSYSQVIRAYPTGGGSYAASRENLGAVPGLVSAASLLIDYVLTVAVSVAAGVQALTSIAPQLYPYRVVIDLLVITVLVVGNLRGVRESGNLFSVPTYFYLLSLLTMLTFGFFKLLTGTLPSYVPPPDRLQEAAAPLGFLLILRAFSSGAVALTGVEAVSNGMRVVKPPESRNANVVLIWMAILFGTLFVGISFFSAKVGLVPDPTEQETLISQLARLLVGSGPLHFVIQAATALILLLAANTAFVGFPRLSFVLAADRFFPNQFLHRGNRLALSTGIIAVGSLAGLFVVIFRGSVAALIPLYTVGVFVAFTLSQAGMVRMWRREKKPGWRISIVLNWVGMVVTGAVAVEALMIKFVHGAWIIFILIPLLVLMMTSIHRHYQLIAKELHLEPSTSLPKLSQARLALVLVADLNKSAMTALAYAKSLAPEVIAVNVSDNVASMERLRKRWEHWAKGIQLVCIEAPYRNWTGALISYINAISKENPDMLLPVVIPEFVPRRWWENLLHSQSALRLKMALLSKPNVVVIDVPFHLET